MTDQPLTCRAQRWKNATPVYEGDHPGHLFYYGEHSEYRGYCAGWPKP